MSRVPWVLMLVVLCASPAAAQKVDGNGVPYREWDVHGAVGFHTSDRDDGSARSDPYYESWEPAWSVSFDVGRYWTSHLKTEAGIYWLSRVQYYAQEPITAPNGQQIGQAFSNIDARQTQVVVAGVYQFLENTFAHPYVSAGARVGVLDLRVFSNQYLFPSGNPPVPTVPAPQESRRERELRVRPFVALGSKSYFSERVFMRPEMLCAIDERGVGQFGLRLGLGIDF